jgi:hypothetical protein
MLKRDIRYALGVESEIQPQSMVFVQASIDSIEEGIGHLYTGEYHQNIYLKGYPGKGFLVFQFVGHSWTIICSDKADDTDFSENFRSEALSQLLGKRVLSYRNIVEFDENLLEPIQTRFGYKIYDSGKLVEHLDFHSPEDCIAYPKWVWNRIICAGVSHHFYERIKEQKIFVPHYRFNTDPYQLSLLQGDTIQITQNYRPENDGISEHDYSFSMDPIPPLEPFQIYEIRPYTDFVRVDFLCLK